MYRTMRRTITVTITETWTILYDLASAHTEVTQEPMASPALQRAHVSHSVATVILSNVVVPHVEADAPAVK